MTHPTEETPTPRDVAILLAELGTLLELNGADSFRARAFTRAARALEGTEADLLTLAREDKLSTLPGIGAGIASVVREYVLTGRSGIYDELREATPVALYDLLRVPGLGPKRIHLIHQELGVEDLDALEQAAQAGKIAALPGFGAKTEAKILEGIEFARSSRRLRRYPEALEIAARIVDWLREQPGVDRAEIAGAIRRRLEVVDQIDLLAASSEPEQVLDALRGLQGAHGAESVADGEAVLKLSDGVAVRLRCVAPARFVEAMVWETGNEAHVAELSRAAAAVGGDFDRDGLRIKGRRVRISSESKLYERLGLQYVPPEMREGMGEVRLAAAGKLPTLVKTEDLQGTFHCHTTASDGKATLEEMADGARAKGWSYLGIADHSRTAAYAGGLSVQQVKDQQRQIASLNTGYASDGPSSFTLFSGIESDILPDGSLDYPDEVLRTFDYVIGSVHSSFRMERSEMTRRMVKAVRNPALTILGHPTGRLLLTRDGYAVEVASVLKEAARSGIVIEINANPHRLDLDWRHVREAAELGILIAINPDAHSVVALDHVAFGINMARKAGLEPRQVLNTWPVDQVKEYFAERKQSR